jgi:hypothetical protein
MRATTARCQSVLAGKANFERVKFSISPFVAICGTSTEKRAIVSDMDD